ncbi:MAG: iron-sulfur cluster assembly scaffold protein [Desulfohalobiaceae bacterium]
MQDPLDSFVSQLQEDIYQQTLQDYGPELFQRWKNPEYMGQIESPSTAAALEGSCGDQMQIQLQIQDQSIVQARFTTTGCGPSIACANTACELAQGKSLEQAAGLEGQDILQTLQNVPEDHEHCAHLAAQTLREAIRKFWTQG